MCGLAGVILKNKTRSDENTGLITSVFTETLVSAEQRGRDASGYAIVNADNTFSIFKQPVDASTLVNRYGYGDDFTGINTGETGIIMGHTRYATKGSRFINKNNHPIRAGSVIGTHNGSVYNDDSLFETFHLERHADVDSEVLFRLFDTATSPDEYFNQMLPKVNGRVTTVFADVEFPQYIYIIKGNNPFEMVYVKELDCIVYASTTEILKRGLTPLEGLEIVDYNIKPNTMIRVNTNNLSMDRREISFRCVVNKPTYTKPTHTKPTRYTDKYAHTVQGFVPRYTFKDALKKNEQCNIWDKPRDNANVKVNTNTKRNSRKTTIMSLKTTKEDGCTGFSCKCGWKFKGMLENSALKAVIRRHGNECPLKS